MGKGLPSVLLVGLGNFTYPYTRHSVGQLLIESLASRLGVCLKDDRTTMSWIGQKEIDIQPRPKKPNKGKDSDAPIEHIRVNLVLVKPKLLMNISGKSVALAYKAYMQPKALSRVIVIHDSLSHKPLSVHPRLGGSSNGHNGVSDVISRLQGAAFHRVRIGIGRPPGVYHDYVLGKLEPRELEYWGECGEGVEKVWNAIESILLSNLSQQTI